MGAEFLDELSETISKTAKGIGSKAEILYGSQKLRSKMSSEERIVEKMIADLGNLIYKRFSAGAMLDDELAGICQEINQHKEKITEYKEEMADLKGQKICPSCDKAVEKEACFCPYCGAPCGTPEEAPGYGAGYAEEPGYAGPSDYAGAGAGYTGEPGYADGGAGYAGEPGYADGGAGYTGEPGYADGGAGYAGEPGYADGGAGYAGDPGYAGTGAPEEPGCAQAPEYAEAVTPEAGGGAPEIFESEGGGEACCGGGEAPAEGTEDVLASEETPAENPEEVLQEWGSQEEAVEIKEDEK